MSRRRKRRGTPRPRPSQPARWRLVVHRPGPITTEWLNLVIDRDSGDGFLDFRPERDLKARDLQRGWAREILRQLRYAGIAYRWERPA